MLLTFGRILFSLTMYDFMIVLYGLVLWFISEYFPFFTFSIPPSCNEDYFFCFAKSEAEVCCFMSDLFIFFLKEWWLLWIFFCSSWIDLPLLFGFIYTSPYLLSISLYIIYRYLRRESRTLSSSSGRMNFVQISLSYFSFRNSSKIGSFNASSTLIRLEGLNSSIFTTKLTSSLSHWKKYSFKGFFFMFNWFIRFSATSLFSELMFYCEGIPVNSAIFSIWFRVDSPGNIGLPISNSAIMHPTLHTSVFFP